MRKEAFSYDSRDGENILHAVRYLPEETIPVCGVVQIVHGMAEYIERYEAFAQYLTDRGFVVTGEDHLGHGESVAEGELYGYFCEQDPATVLVRDVHRLKKLTQELYPGVPYILMGHSMGSFIVRNYLCRYGTGITAAILLGTGMQSKVVNRFSKGVLFLQKLLLGSKHVAKAVDRMVFGSYNRHIPNPKTSYDWLSRDPAVVEQYVQDPLCGFVFTVNGFETILELMSRLYRADYPANIPSDLPVLFASGEEDPVGDYGVGVRTAYESLKKAGLKCLSLKLYPGARHEILNEINREEVYGDLYRWMQPYLSSPADKEVRTDERTDE